RTTALPINSDCTLPYSFKIFNAGHFTGGITRPCSAVQFAVQRSQCSASGTIVDDCSSNSWSRCILKLAGSSGSLATCVVSRQSLERLPAVYVVDVDEGYALGKPSSPSATARENGSPADSSLSPKPCRPVPQSMTTSVPRTVRTSTQSAFPP